MDRRSQKKHTIELSFQILSTNYLDVSFRMVRKMHSKTATRMIVTYTCSTAVLYCMVSRLKFKLIVRCLHTHWYYVKNNLHKKRTKRKQTIEQNKRFRLIVRNAHAFVFILCFFVLMLTFVLYLFWFVVVVAVCHANFVFVSVVFFWYSSLRWILSTRSVARVIRIPSICYR